MIGRRFLYLVVTTAVSVILEIGSFAQGTAAAEAPTAKPSGTQHVFQITPVRPIAELRAEALKAKPPEEQGKFERASLIEVTKVDSTIRLDIRYATVNNFLGEPTYEQAKAFLQMPAAYALGRVNAKLHRQGYGLVILDAYRPWYVTKIFWEAMPPNLREYLADPREGSRHNRGCAVDLTLYDLKTGKRVSMPTQFDEYTPRAIADYDGAGAEEKEHWKILREAMESEGFAPLPNEWWHYDYKDWQKYAVLNVGFEQVPTHIYQVGGTVTPPKILRKVDPEFSLEARDDRREGTVVLSLVVDEKGEVRDVRVVRALSHGLDEQAMKALKQWKFQPAMKDGKAVAVQINVEVAFRFWRER